MQIKKQLRSELIKKRSEIADRTYKDSEIMQRLISLAEFINAETVLCYASLDGEIETDSIISYALSQGKKVAVPHCVNKCGIMDFYLINSLDKLNVGSFNIREPDININKKLEDFEKSIIIVPGVAYSVTGHRLGYGGGYYDRFMSSYKYRKIGLCYDGLLLEALPHNEFDIPVDIVITDKQIININGGDYGF